MRRNNTTLRGREHHRFRAVVYGSHSSPQMVRALTSQIPHHATHEGAGQNHSLCKTPHTAQEWLCPWRQASPVATSWPHVHVHDAPNLIKTKCISERADSSLIPALLPSHTPVAKPLVEAVTVNVLYRDCCLVVHLSQGWVVSHTAENNRSDRAWLQSAAFTRASEAVHGNFNNWFYPLFCVINRQWHVVSFSLSFSQNKHPNQTLVNSNSPSLCPDNELLFINARPLMETVKFCHSAAQEREYFCLLDPTVQTHSGSPSLSTTIPRKKKKKKKTFCMLTWINHAAVGTGTVRHFLFLFSHWGG